MSNKKQKSTRTALSKKVRFEVFKRDSFKCQYCGKSAPDVVLHVDHINPVSNDGTNDIMNLITSCSECNLGKGAKTLD
ncbi:HNH endonuclease, partial [Pasteurella multocida]